MESAPATHSLRFAAVLSQEIFEQAADAVEEAAVGQGVFLRRFEDFRLGEARGDGARGGSRGPPRGAR